MHVKCLQMMRSRNPNCDSEIVLHTNFPMGETPPSTVRVPLPRVYMLLHSSVGIRRRPFRVVERGIKAWVITLATVHIPRQLFPPSNSSPQLNSTMPITSFTQPNSQTMRFLEYLSALAAFTAVLAVPFPGPIPDTPVKGQY